MRRSSVRFRQAALLGPAAPSIRAGPLSSCSDPCERHLHPAERRSSRPLSLEMGVYGRDRGRAAPRPRPADRRSWKGTTHDTHHPQLAPGARCARRHRPAQRVWHARQRRRRTRPSRSASRSASRSPRSSPAAPSRSTAPRSSSRCGPAWSSTAPTARSPTPASPTPSSPPDNTTWTVTLRGRLDLPRRDAGHRRVLRRRLELRPPTARTRRPGPTSSPTSRATATCRPRWTTPVSRPAIPPPPR